MIRILSYNILYGGTGRVNALTKMIASVQPDIVGLVEASDLQVVEELARRLDMQWRITGNAKNRKDLQIAVLSRLPIVDTQVHRYPGILTKPLMEVCVEETTGNRLTLYITHLTAAFNQLRAGDHIRRREVRQLLRIMATKGDAPHLLIGDFNVLAPGDALRASMLLRHLLDMDRRYKDFPSTLVGQPNLNFVLPPSLRAFRPIFHAIPHSRVLSILFDVAVSFYAPRGSIDMLLKAGYVDCFRRMNPGEKGFTCPTSWPAGRIDFMFASPHMAQRLVACRVITSGEGVPGEQASDHFPVFAEFRQEEEVRNREREGVPPGIT